MIFLCIRFINFNLIVISKYRAFEFAVSYPHFCNCCAPCILQDISTLPVQVDFDFLNVTGTLIGFVYRQKRCIIITKLQDVSGMDYSYLEELLEF